MIIMVVNCGRQVKSLIQRKQSPAEQEDRAPIDSPTHLG